MQLLTARFIDRDCATGKQKRRSRNTMSLKTKLLEWNTAGIIDTRTVEAILQHEKKESRPILMYALGSLGALAIAVGLISVVAANWDGIQDGIKLGTALLIGVSLAAGVYVCHTTQRRWSTEILVMLYYGFTLATFALLGQVYQSGMEPFKAFIIWTIVTTPLVLIGQSYLLGMVWLAGLVTSHVICFFALWEYIDANTSSRVSLDIAAAVVFLSPFVYLLIGRIPGFVRLRASYSNLFAGAAWSVLAGMGFLSQFIWYNDISNDDVLRYSIAVCNGSSLLFIVFLKKLYPTLTKNAHIGVAVALVATCLSASIGMSFERSNIDLVGALSNLIFLGGVAYTCLSLHAYRWFHVTTGLIAARLIAIYFELFASMMNTGIGLVTGGALTIFAAWLWRKKTNRWIGIVTEKEKAANV
jgi:uncharacterized membrane protein